jgi:hypothetical protein
MPDEKRLTINIRQTGPNNSWFYTIECYDTRQGYASLYAQGYASSYGRALKLVGVALDEYGSIV